MPVKVSNPNPTSIPSGQGGHSGYFSVPCAGAQAADDAGSYRSRPSGSEMKSWRTGARMEWTTDLGIFNDSDSLRGLRQRGHKFIIPDFHGKHQPRKQQWAQDQNCRLPTEASEPRAQGSDLRFPLPQDHDVTKQAPLPTLRHQITSQGVSENKLTRLGGELTEQLCKMRLSGRHGHQRKLKKLQMS